MPNFKCITPKSFNNLAHVEGKVIIDLSDTSEVQPQKKRRTSGNESHDDNEGIVWDSQQQKLIQTFFEKWAEQKKAPFLEVFEKSEGQSLPVLDKILLSKVNFMEADSPMSLSSLDVNDNHQSDPRNNIEEQSSNNLSNSPVVVPKTSQPSAYYSLQTVANTSNASALNPSSEVYTLLCDGLFSTLQKILSSFLFTWDLVISQSKTLPSRLADNLRKSKRFDNPTKEVLRMVSVDEIPPQLMSYPQDGTLLVRTHVENLISKSPFLNDLVLFEHIIRKLVEADGKMMVISLTSQDLELLRILLTKLEEEIDVLAETNFDKTNDKVVIVTHNIILQVLRCCKEAIDKFKQEYVFTVSKAKPVSRFSSATTPPRPNVSQPPPPPSAAPRSAVNSTTYLSTPTYTQPIVYSISPTPPISLGPPNWPIPYLPVYYQPTWTSP